MPAFPVITKYEDLYDVQALGDDEILVPEGGTLVVKHLSDVGGFVDFATLADVPSGNGIWARESGALVWKPESDFVASTDSRLTDQRVPTDGSVSTAKVADGAVTTAKIADGAVTAAKADNSIVKGSFGSGANSAVDELTVTAPSSSYKSRRVPIADKAIHDLREFYSGTSQPSDVLGHIQDGLARTVADGGVLLIPDSVEPWDIGAGICPPPNSRMIGPGRARFNTKLSDAGHGSLSYSLPALPNTLGEAWIRLAAGANCPILYNDYTNAQGLRGPLESGGKYWQWFEAFGIVFDHNGSHQTGALRAIDIRQAWGMNFSHCRLVSPRGQGWVFDQCNECNGEKVSSVGEFEASSNGTGSTTSDSNSVTSATGTWAVGDLIVGSGIPSGTFVSAVSGTTLTLSKTADASAQNATATATGVALSKWVPMATSLLSLLNLTTDCEWLGCDMHAASVGTLMLDGAVGSRVSGLFGYAIGGCDLVMQDSYGGGCFGNKVDARLDQASKHNARVDTPCKSNSLDLTCWMPGLFNKAADADGGWAAVFCDGTNNNLRGTGRRRITSMSNMSCLVRYGANAKDNRGFMNGGDDIATGTPLYAWNGSDGVSTTGSNSSPVPGWSFLPGTQFRAVDGTTAAEVTYLSGKHKFLELADAVTTSVVDYFVVPNGCRSILIRLELVNLDNTKAGNVRLQAGYADTLIAGQTFPDDETVLGPASVAVAASDAVVSTSFTGNQVTVHAGQILAVRVKRFGADALDTLAASVGLVGVRIEPLMVS